MSKLSTIAAISAVVFAILLAPAAAQLSNQPLTIIVGTSPGSGPDMVARTIGLELQKRLGVPVVVENKVGASGSIGATFVARAAPDGNTLLSVVDPNFTPSVALLKNVSFDPITSFSPVSEVAIAVPVLAVSTKLPVKSAAEFVRYAKAHPGKLNYGSPGVGTAQHLSMELFKRDTKIEVMHVPFKETAGLMSAFIGGHVDAVFVLYHLALPLPKDKVRLLGLANNARIDPELPTLSEQGFANFEADNRYGFLAPANTPRDIVMRYNTAIREIMEMPETIEKFRRQGFVISVGTPEEYGEKIKRDMKKWHQLIEDAKISSN